MSAFGRHVGRCLVAGIVAILPVGGTILTIVLAEQTISESWLDRQGFYFPGLGLILVFLAVYALGLVVTTFLGRWLWRAVDRVLSAAPVLGSLYRTLKQILGYGEGRDAMFHRVVMVTSPFTGAEEVGLVTNEVADADGASKLLVFLPGAPNPTTGRLLVADAAAVRDVDTSVHEALKSLVSVGKNPIR